MYRIEEAKRRNIRKRIAFICIFHTSEKEKTAMETQTEMFCNDSDTDWDDYWDLDEDDLDDLMGELEE